LEAKVVALVGLQEQVDTVETEAYLLGVFPNWVIRAIGIVCCFRLV